jgi:protein-tyrosine phosphatase
MRPLQPLHPESSLSPAKLDEFMKITTERLLKSLEPGQPGALKVRDDGTIVDGHHRIAVLRRPRRRCGRAAARDGKRNMSTTLYVVPGPWKGRLAIAPRPRGGAWLRDDIEAFRTAGVDLLISALTNAERAELDLADEEAIARVTGIEYLSFPIEDRGVPRSEAAVWELVERLRADLQAGRTVAIHCRSAIGRSSLLAAAVLATTGVAPDTAFQEISQVRGLSVPDTPEQQAWLSSYVAKMLRGRQRAAS